MAGLQLQRARPHAEGGNYSISPQIDVELIPCCNLLKSSLLCAFAVKDHMEWLGLVPALWEPAAVPRSLLFPDCLFGEI